MRQKNKSIVSNKLATKTDVKNVEKSLRVELLGLEGKIEQSDENARNYRDQILTSNDKLAKTLEIIREDIEIGNFQMKRKNPLSENATKGDILILKQELKQEMQGLRKEIVSEIDEKNEKYKDEAMTKLDDISGQLEDLQQDKVLSIHQTSQLREEIEDHDKRIKHLEKLQQTA